MATDAALPLLSVVRKIHGWAVAYGLILLSGLAMPFLLLSDEARAEGMSSIVGLSVFCTLLGFGGLVEEGYMLNGWRARRRHRKMHEDMLSRGVITQATFEMTTCRRPIRPDYPSPGPAPKPKGE